MDKDPSSKISSNHFRKGFLQLALSGLVVGLLYVTHLSCCQHSAMRFFDAEFNNSDMQANILWAKSIREQGWLNPEPYHPYNEWMQAVAPYSQWLQWWGRPQIFQQSPLYAYLLALFLDKPVIMRLIQVAIHVATCVFIGLLTRRLVGGAGGWVAFWLAALYGPFYAYSWPLLRDELGWLITAILLWGLTELTQTNWSSQRARQLGWLVGVLLGLGFLAKETFSLVIAVTLLVLSIFSWKRRNKTVITRVAVGTFLAMLPLLIRNYSVEAPLLSSSNRFAEAFIVGNTGTVNPYLFSWPKEGKQILRNTGGKTIPVIHETIATHADGFAGWLRLQGNKILSLFDPYELPDNLSIYFMENISPVVRYALRYWMVIVPALAGLIWSFLRRDGAHLWLWLFLPVFLTGIIIGLPLSRYRQALMIFFIPWAACFFSLIFDLVRRRELRKAAGCFFMLMFGWLMVLGPLTRYPRNHYERPAEYFLAKRIYLQLGEQKQATEMQNLIREKFPQLNSN